MTSHHHILMVRSKSLHYTHGSGLHKGLGHWALSNKSTYTFYYELSTHISVNLGKKWDKKIIKLSPVRYKYLFGELVSKREKEVKEIEKGGPTLWFQWKRLSVKNQRPECLIKFMISTTRIQCKIISFYVQLFVHFYVTLSVHVYVKS